jgi:hypothetical protein
MNRQDFYNASYVAFFGGLWGVTEIILGNLLHMTGTPFRGTILSALGCIICLVGSYLLPVKTKLPILSMGIIALLIRLFSFGIFKIHIFLSILTAALLMQMVISAFGYNLFSFIMAGILSCFSPYISALGFFWFIMQQEGLALYHGILKDVHVLNAIAHGGWIIIALFILLVNIAIGSMAGIMAYYLGNKLKYDLLA